MSHTQMTRIGAAIGSAVLASMLLASPALAKPGPSKPEYTSTVRAGDVRQIERASVSGTAIVLPGDVRRVDGNPATPSGGSTATRVVVAVDDNSVELAQVGLGVLAGVAVAGLGISTVSAMRRRHVPGTA